MRKYTVLQNSNFVVSRTVGRKLQGIVRNTACKNRPSTLKVGQDAKSKCKKGHQFSIFRTFVFLFHHSKLLRGKVRPDLRVLSRLIIARF